MSAIMADLTQQLIERHEARKYRKYQDTHGNWTNGVGHNLKNAAPCADVCAHQQELGLPVDDNWDDYSVDTQYYFDLRANAFWLWQKPWWNAVSPERQAALNDMAFNMGEPTFSSFSTFLGLCAVGDWDAAAMDLLKTAVYHELPHRYGELETILRTGSVAGILT
jgi:GH24 family phage-related lysozyme (muramidase)